jgi:phosphoglycerate dehydrogenase-like enzyme
LLPDGALVGNVGRGPVLDTSEILVETESGRLRAALDGTDPEPLPPATRCGVLKERSLARTPREVPLDPRAESPDLDDPSRPRGG